MQLVRIVIAVLAVFFLREAVERPGVSTCSNWQQHLLS
jgi:hypothetical protein